MTGGTIVCGQIRISRVTSLITIVWNPIKLARSREPKEASTSVSDGMFYSSYCKKWIVENAWAGRLKIARSVVIFQAFIGFHHFDK